MKFEPGVEGILAILSVLSTGAAYLPLDPRHGDQRIDQILTAWAPVGPVARALTELRRTLDEHDVELLRWRRTWEPTYPHQQKWVHWEPQRSKERPSPLQRCKLALKKS